jgi:hypothetical protein
MSREGDLPHRGFFARFEGKGYLGLMGCHVNCGARDHASPGVTLILHQLQELRLAAVEVGFRNAFAGPQGKLG